MNKILKKSLFLSLFVGVAAALMGLTSCNKYSVEFNDKKEMSNNVTTLSTSSEPTLSELTSYARSYKYDSKYMYSKLLPNYYQQYCRGIDYNVYDFIDNALLSINPSISKVRVSNYSNGNINSFTLKKGKVYSADDAAYEDLVKLGLSTSNSYIYIVEDDGLCQSDVFSRMEYSSKYDELLNQRFQANNEELIIVPKYNFTLNSGVVVDETPIEEYTMYDTISPNFSNANTHIIVNVDNMLSIEEIKSQISAYDETDGNITDRIVVVSTTYNPSNKTIGMYSYVVSVSDNAGNKTTATFYIDVADITAPMIEGKNVYSIEYDSANKPTLETIKSSLTLTDNYDSDLSLIAVNDGYTGNESIVGMHTIELIASDSSENSSDSFIINVYVTDSKAPVITCPSTIDCQTSKQVSISNLKNKIIVEDGYDGVITNYTIIDNDDYATNYSKVGKYTFTINAKDGSGNVANCTFTLDVTDNIFPEIFVARNFVIVIPVGESLTKDMILKYLDNVGEIELSQVASCSYDVDTKQRGVYKCSIGLVDGSTYETQVVVADYDDEGNSVVDYEYPFNKIFTKEFWKYYAEDWKNIKMWSWVHWTTLGIGAILLLSLLLGVAALFFGRKRYFGKRR